MCDELGDMKWNVSLMLMMLIVTVWRRCFRGDQATAKLFLKNRGERRGSEM